MINRQQGVLPGRLLALIGISLFLVGHAALAAPSLQQVQALMNDGKLPEALRANDEILAGDSNNLQAQFTRGLILTRMDKLDEAEKIFLQLNKEHPELPEPYNNLAVIYASQGQFEKARDALQKAISTHPSYATAHENIGDIYAKMASQAYNQALELDKGNETARAKLSLVNELFSTHGQVQQAPARQVAEKTPPRQEVAPVAPAAPAPVPVKQAPPATAAVEPVPAPPPAATPAPAQPPAPDAQQEKQKQLQADLMDAVNDWAGAWSKQDVDAYIAHYAPDYTPSGDVNHQAWMDQRRSRIKAPSYIKVKISSPDIKMFGDDHAQVTFLQSYTSDTINDTINKTLLLRNLNNRWLIVQEKIK